MRRAAASQKHTAFTGPEPPLSSPPDRRCQVACSMTAEALRGGMDMQRGRLMEDGASPRTIPNNVFSCVGGQQPRSTSDVGQPVPLLASCPLLHDVDSWSRCPSSGTNAPLRGKKKIGWLAGEVNKTGGKQETEQDPHKQPSPRVLLHRPELGLLSPPSHGFVSNSATLGR